MTEGSGETGGKDWGRQIRKGGKQNEGRSVVELSLRGMSPADKTNTLRSLI